MIANRWVQELSKIDFVTSTGLYILPDQLILVRLRKNFRRVSLLVQEARELPENDGKQGISELTGWIPEDVREIALSATNESRERALRQALLSLMPHVHRGRDSLYICVPQDQAIIQEIYLPKAAEANLKEVLDYEIERYIPFRRDDVYYDFLPGAKKGDKIGVFVFAIPKRNLATVLEVLSSFGIKPKSVETTATALANYILFCAPDTAVPATIIGAHDNKLELVGIQRNAATWKPSPELIFSHCLKEPKWDQGIERDLLKLCVTKAGRIYGWGDVEEIVQSTDGGSFEHEDLVAIGNQKIKGGNISQASVLPAIGAALRGIREAPFAGNVLSGDVSLASGTGVLSYVNAALAAILVLATLAWGLTYPIKDELRLRQLQRENRKLEPSVEALRREEEQLVRARKEKDFFSQLDEHRGEVLRVLDELSKIVPNNAYLSNLRYRSGGLEVQGSAENASGLIPVLERSPVFENVGFNAPSNRGRDNRETFSLKADLEKPKEKATKQ